MVFEHRNYLASVGPLIFLAYLITAGSRLAAFVRVAIAVGALLLVSYSAVTYIRVNNWSSYKSFILSSAENHPNQRAAISWPGR